MNKLSNVAIEAFPSKGLLEMLLDELITSVDNQFIVDVVQRQIYSERQRYTVKKEVDKALLSSPRINLTTETIKSICSEEGPQYVENYLKLLAENLKRLVTVTGEFCTNFNAFSQSPDKFRGYLERYIPIADIDNAHAMYLSSDNWSFSVFHNILSQIESKYPDRRTQSEILKGGIVDIRTYVYRVANQYVITDTLEEHVVNCISRELVHQQLFSPMLFFPFSKRLFHKSTYETIQKPEMPSCSLVDAYKSLYHARYLYDSLEYFGYYGIVRNAIAELCYQHYVKTNVQKFKVMAEYITLYQFNLCN